MKNITQQVRMLAFMCLGLLMLSACGNNTSETRAKTQLTAPTGLSLTLNGQSLKVDWNAVTRASSYKVYLAEQPMTTLNTPSFANHGSLTGSQTQAVNSGTTHTFTGLGYGKTYYVLVQSIGDVNTTLKSTYANGQEQSKLIPIVAPTNVQFKKSGTDYLLTWEKPAGINDFAVYTAKSDLSGKTAAQLDALLNDTDANKKTTKTSRNTNQYTITGLNATDKVYAVVVSVANSTISTPALTDTGFVKKGQRFYKMQGQAGKCVVDLDKNLTWEVKQASGLHGKDHTYTWYNPDSNTNGGNAGKQNGGTCYKKSDTTISGNQCDTTGFVNSVNAETWCGFNDWRMPTGRSGIETGELGALIDKSRGRPTINTDYFTNTVAAEYWSSFTDIHANSWARIVSFTTGAHRSSFKTNAGRVRLVRDRGGVPVQPTNIKSYKKATLGTTATDDTYSMVVNWGGQPGVSDYDVYTSTTNLANKTLAQIKAMTTASTPMASKARVTSGTSYTLNNATKGTQYYAVVVAVNGTKESIPSAVISETAGERLHKITGHEDKCVLDVTTPQTLIWEVKQASGLHGKDHTYSWYQTTNNEGYAGWQNKGKCHNKSNTTTSGNQCDTTGFVNSVNAETWCGFKDWRLPAGKGGGTNELGTLVDMNSSPKINTDYFPRTVGAVYWSSSPDTDSNRSTWGMHFYHGNGAYYHKLNRFRARLVRAR